MKAIVICAILVISCGLALAGPNGGGTLIVHCAGVETASSDASLCAHGPDPADCFQVVTRVDAESGDYPAIFRVYAAFPASRSPRLMGVTWGISYDPAKLFVDGFINCTDFSLSDTGWPDSGTGTSETWDTVQSGHMVKIYAFSAYTGHQDACTFTLTPNPTQGAYFGDDAVPAVLDPIAGFGRLGFHSNGTVACPSEFPSGACCAPDSACSYVLESACLQPSVWKGDWTVCTPNPCLPVGACCAPTGICVLIVQASCASPSTWHAPWTECSPNPCPVRIGACCGPAGTCLVTLQASCVSPSVWHSEWPDCAPNRCPQIPTGPCCAPGGACALTTQALCGWPSVWHQEWGNCSPNLCPTAPAGACCANIGGCVLTTQAQCTFLWHGEWTGCWPNPCPQPPGACCAPTGACTLVLRADCLSPAVWYGWTSPFCSPNPCPQPSQPGACCFPTGECSSLTNLDCAAAGGGFQGAGTTCGPNPCTSVVGVCCSQMGMCTLVPQTVCVLPSTWFGEYSSCSSARCVLPVPVQHTTWGRIKASYR